MLDLYRNIKEKRKELGLSQEELAKRVGYSGKSMISKIEKGEVDLSTTMIKKFAEALGTTPTDLLGNPYCDMYIAEDDMVIETNQNRIEKALDLYSHFENSIPEIQKAVENLLKVPQSDE